MAIALHVAGIASASRGAAFAHVDDSHAWHALCRRVVRLRVGSLRVCGAQTCRAARDALGSRGVYCSLHASSLRLPIRSIPGLNLRRAATTRRCTRCDAGCHFLRNASVATQEEAYTHLALDDPNATLLPENPAQRVDTCYVLIDRDFPDSPRLQEYGAELQELITARVYVVDPPSGGIELYRRSKSATPDAARSGQPCSANNGAIGRSPRRPTRNLQA